jgi:ABC-type lipoprotein export system ATPase subunit
LLSGGEQQRIAVCAALAHRPPLLLADEPGGELDSFNATVVYTLIRELAREQGATALVVSHDPGATEIADRLIMIRDGRVVEEARPGGSSALVLGRGGWLRLPEPVRHEAGIGRRAAVRTDAGKVILERADSAPEDVQQTAELPPRTEDGESVAELRGVAKRFERQGTTHLVFDGLDAAFRRGRLTLVVGRSGSGKTTLLNLLSGLDRPTEGEVCVLGRPISNLSRTELARLRRNQIGIVGQEPGLVPFLSAAENVALTLSLRHDIDGAPARARRALEIVGLDDRRDQHVIRLSAGERQRVAVARALAHEPDLLLADEPTARLDETNAQMIARLLLHAARALDIAVVCATHDPALFELGDERLSVG